MKERPILFSAPMVRAILDSRKTQTRRVVKGVALDWLNAGFTPEYVASKENSGVCPYGQPGDQLYVRETWRIGAWDENRPAVAIDYCDGPRKQWVDVPDPDCYGDGLFDRLCQQSADDAIKAGLKTNEHGNYKWEPGQSPCRWRPSIHMPRWASRILLEITSVRVERLQDISESDCISEGCAGGHGAINGYAYNATPQEHYLDLWESINGTGSWDTNPWVWVVEFCNVSK